MRFLFRQQIGTTRRNLPSAVVSDYNRQSSSTFRASSCPSGAITMEKLVSHFHFPSFNKLSTQKSNQTQSSRTNCGLILRATNWKRVDTRWSSLDATGNGLRLGSIFHLEKQCFQDISMRFFTESKQTRSKRSKANKIMTENVFPRMWFSRSFRYLLFPLTVYTFYARNLLFRCFERWTASRVREFSFNPDSCLSVYLSLVK